jgi:16S rRNA (guanine527-N7)-methyltransferase
LRISIAGALQQQGCRLAKRAESRPDLADDRARALTLTPVSRETAEKLDRFVALLLDWQGRTNLIAPSTVSQLWTRHIADSLQLVDLAPTARIWIDVGSGAGFPGVVIACALADDAGAQVHLIDSNVKKAAFLREAQRVTAAPAVIHCARMEAVTATLERADVVCARAVAPLNPLLHLCFPLMKKTKALGLFPKGENAQAELQEAALSWRMQVKMVKSRTNPKASIIAVRDLWPRPQ